MSAGTQTLRAPTGIDILDRKLNGGFRRPSLLLFFSENLAEKRIFAEQFLIAGLRAGETTLLVDFFRAPQLVRRELQKFGQYRAENLVILDATSAQAMIPSQERYIVRNLDSLEEIRTVVGRALEETRATRVVMDSLEYLTERFPKDEVLDFLRDLNAQAHRTGSTLAFLFINWSYGPSELEEVQGLADYVVEFKTTQRGGIALNTLRVRDRRDSRLETNWIPYTFREMLGLLVYFPRILVTGPHSAGKSTLIHSLCKSSVSVDRLGTTVAFDYGNVEVSGVEAEIFGTPGQERFEFIFKIFAREVNGILLVVDSTDPETFNRARHLRALAGERLPCVVAANKSDLPGAASLDDIRRALEMGQDIPIVKTVATTGDGLRQALQALVDLIIWGR